MVYLQIEKLFSTYLREKQFLQGASPATVRINEKSLVAFKHFIGCTCELSDAKCRDFMAVMVGSGEIKPSSANGYARCFNSFLTWLHTNGHTPTHLKVPLTSTPKRVLQTYTADEIRRIVTHKPTSRTQKRMLAILFVLIDTGARVSEALSLTRKDVDFENLLVTLTGKGNKQRTIPISIECRKRLYVWLGSHDHEIVFATESGGKLLYENARREFLALLRACKVEKNEGSFHAFRRFFGKTYIRNGGDSLYLKRLFGHTTLQMTAQYVDADTESLQQAHKRLSPLESVKGRR